ncbi:adenylosuccinate synthetase, partial [Nocardia cyriacigeorgica]|nr:adenylosuccinate synthetase [Nocardia cyriacigeorgica]
AYDTPDGVVTALTPGRWRDLEHQERLTTQLSAATPVLVPVETDPADWLAARLGLPVALTGHGPDRRDRVVRDEALLSADTAGERTVDPVLADAVAVPGGRAR